MEHLPAYSFGLKTQVEKPSDTPAPNAYKPDKPAHAPEYSFGVKTAVEKPSATPGEFAAALLYPLKFDIRRGCW